MEDLQRAKELFKTCLGSVIQMHRAGVFAEYKQFDITKEIELEWFAEMINDYSKALSIRDWNALDSLRAIAKLNNEITILTNVSAFATKHIMSADSIVKLMYAEGLIDLIKSTKQLISNDSIYEAYKVTMQILEDVISKPLIIDPGHELHLYQLQDKKSLNNRAKKNMDDIKSYLS